MRQAQEELAALGGALKEIVGGKKLGVRAIGSENRPITGYLRPGERLAFFSKPREVYGDVTDVFLSANTLRVNAPAFSFVRLETWVVRPFYDVNIVDPETGEPLVDLYSID